MKFSEFGLSEDILASITRHGYEEATPIQEKTIPITLQGKDVIGQAQTGTGKTAAFGLPILEMIDVNNKNIQALIVSPTRELANQTQEEMFKLGKDKHVKVQAIFGGTDIRRQISNLNHGTNIVVGTPGRLIDHINRGTIKLNNIKTLVLDEADEMLNMGFLEDIEAILKAVPDKRQTLLFSATMPDSIKRIGVKFMTDPEHIKIAAKELTTDLVDQYYVRMKENEKFDVLTNSLDVQQPALAILFGRTKRRVDELTRGLQLKGFSAVGIHGDLTQQKRSQVLKQFKAKEIKILVATDVAARGLDVSGVTHVYNFDIPQDPESYVHRIGRTGRAGSKGNSITFVTNSEMDYLNDIEKLTKKRMNTLKPYTRDEAIKGRIKVAVSSIEKMIESTTTDLFEEITDELLEKYDSKKVISALINQVADIKNMEESFTLSHERPLPRKKSGFSNNRRSSGRRNNDRNRGSRSGSSDRDRGSRSGSSDRNRGSRSSSSDRNRGSRSGSSDRDRGFRSGSSDRDRGTRSGSSDRNRGTRSGSSDRSQRSNSGSDQRSKRNFVIHNEK